MYVGFAANETFHVKMRNFRLNFANIFAKMNVGKKFENDAKF